MEKNILEGLGYENNKLIVDSYQNSDFQTILDIIDKEMNKDLACEVVLNTAFDFNNGSRVNMIDGMIKFALDNIEKYKNVLKNLISYCYHNCKYTERFFLNPYDKGTLYLDNNGEIISLKGDIKGIKESKENSEIITINKIYGYEVLTGIDKGKLIYDKDIKLLEPNKNDEVGKYKEKIGNEVDNIIKSEKNIEIKKQRVERYKKVKDTFYKYAFTGKFNGVPENLFNSFPVLGTSISYLKKLGIEQGGFLFEKLTGGSKYENILTEAENLYGKYICTMFGYNSVFDIKPLTEQQKNFYSFNEQKNYQSDFESCYKILDLIVLLYERDNNIN